MKSKGVVWGGLLIGAGIFMMAAQFDILPYNAIVAALGLCGLILALITQRPGWAIPGSILLCIGSAILVTSWNLFIISDAVIFLTALALSFFLMVPFVCRTQGSWPMIPGSIILAVAFFAFLGDSSSFALGVRDIVSNFWPVLIILAGVWIIASQFTGRKRGRQVPPPPQWNGYQQPIPPPVRPESAKPEPEPVIVVEENPQPQTDGGPQTPES